MGRKKKTESAASQEIEEVAPIEQVEQVEQDEAPKRNPAKINDEQEAIDFVRSNFNVPEHIQTVFVAEDKNVFYRANPAKVHCTQNNIKLFTIKWQA